MVEMMVTKGQKWKKGQHLKVIAWLNYGGEGAGVEWEALFVMKDVCIMKYPTVHEQLFQHLSKVENIELAYA